jgi:hypothetical protein
MELLERCSPGMYPIRSLSDAIFEVVANPRAVLVPVVTSLLENMPWSELEMVKLFARVPSVTPQSSISIIDDTHVASDPVPWFSSLFQTPLDTEVHLHQQ